jgi:hypothetical protein
VKSEARGKVERLRKIEKTREEKGERRRAATLEDEKEK